MKCQNCGFENPAGFAFCGKCGVSLSLVCPRCSFQNPLGLAFCGKCGAPLAVSQVRLSTADLDHLRTYLPASLIEGLQLDQMSPSTRLLEQCLARLSELLKTTVSHLPGYLVEHLLGEPIPGQASGQFVSGALLFADISGFTAMSERLSRIGREGAEEITNIVNRYFDVMLSILRGHDGQLITFGGDALLGLFLEPDSAARAVHAALSMQTAMVDFAETRTSQGVFPLQMKAGVHQGRFFAAQMGTSRSMEYALFGADVNTTAAAESAALAGQVLIDRVTLQAINVPCRAVPAPGDERFFAVEHLEPMAIASGVHSISAPLSAHLPAEPTLDSLRRTVTLLDALTPYLPTGLLARMIVPTVQPGASFKGPGGIAGESYSSALEGEHRLVTVLFANVHGLGDMADGLGVGHEEQIVAALNRYFIAMEDAIQRFGGVINKFDLYDQGDKLLAFFGAPLAHEDDAERAVRAALSMQETLNSEFRVPNSEFGLSQQIGINTGYVFAGYVGTDWRHEYTVMGDEVNLAARLMSVAEPGGVVVSSNVRRKVRALFDLTPRGEVSLKGKSEPVSIFSVAGARAAPEPLRGLEGMRSSLVGRETEWDQLLAAMDQLLAGRGQIVSITGEAGLGKSRLAAELRQQMRGSAVDWFEGRCLSYTESVSFWPFQELIRQVIGLKPDDGEAEAWSKVRRAVDTRVAPEEDSATQAYLANFLGLPLDAALQDKLRYLDAEALQRRTFVAIRTLLETQAKSAPLVLVLEDIHWIDQASLNLLEYLMLLVDRAPLMWILLYRPDREKGCWRIHEKTAREFPHCATEIALRRLTLADSQQLLVNLVGRDHWPAGALESVLGRIDGNPLYLEEVIRALIDDGALIRDESGGWHVGGALDTSRVPDTLQGVMMSRLDRLEESCRRAAQVASVVGRTFAFDVLAHVMPDDEAELNPYLVRLQQQEIVHEAQRRPELVYAFKHGMMQEVCYSSLLARIRRLYHRQIAQYLEASQSDSHGEIGRSVPLLAHHTYAGEDWLRALRYQLLAGQQAQQLFANHEAIDHFQKALHSAENLPPAETREARQTLHAALGELLTTIGQYEQALDHLHRARALATERGDRDAQAHVYRWLARVYELRGDYPPALDWIRQGLAALEGRETTEAAEMRITAGLIHTRQGDYNSALDQCQNALRVAQQLNEVSALARACNLLGHITRLLGQSAMAIEGFQQAFDLYQRAGDIHGQAISQNQIANVCFNIGQWQQADRHYRHAREAFSLLGDVYNRAFADNNLGGIALNQGRLDEALAFYQEALQSLEQIGGSLWAVGALHNNLGAAHIRRGDIAAARQSLRASQDHFEQAQVRDFLPELQRHFAEAALLAGELSEADAHGQHALNLARELSMQSEEGSTLRVLGEISTTHGRFDEAEERLRKSLSILEEVGDQYEAARSRLSLARLHTSWGKREEGLGELDRCLEVFQRLDAALDVATARALREEAAGTS